MARPLVGAVTCGHGPARLGSDISPHGWLPACKGSHRRHGVASPIGSTHDQAACWGGRLRAWPYPFG
ncbi:hypothetical protein B296_00036566 [Ensete ventricosum]|uniref:Uncharacterized protein n=1 Tax=Ensete ventricosum TaxID=4639 RepID=A0A426Z9T2_ENSVE|nr:hypothetical protein B296_00036566 [Ensete ventricosum]